MLDTYDEQEKLKLVNYWMTNPKVLKNWGIGLRDLSGFLIMHSQVSRSEHLLATQLPDLWTRILKPAEEGPVHCPVLGITSHQSKMNQVGRVEYKACVRHRDPRVCAMGKVAFWLFYRWEVEKEPPPNTLVAREWYDLYLIKNYSRRGDPEEGST